MALEQWLLELERLKQEALQAFEQAGSLEDLAKQKIRFLGKKGELTALLKKVGSLPAQDRPKLGERVNAVKAALTQVLAEHAARLKELERLRRIESERVDVTLPGRRSPTGAFHPIQKGMMEMLSIFEHMGFRSAEGPEIEDEFHNFDALNIPAEHPARAMHDTFFLEKRGDASLLLRTHTSPVQVRAMRKFILDGGRPPLSVVACGRVYRCDNDVTHSPMFHQIEVFRVDRACSMAELKGVLQYFLSSYFGRNVPIRMRPSYFPFTEPSAEVDIACVLCDGKGCRVCKETGWLEVLGSGMIHPHVLSAVGIDPGAYSGFAFGLGVERLVMLKHAIPDLRLFYENDVRFIERLGA